MCAPFGLVQYCYVSTERRIRRENIWHLAGKWEDGESGLKIGRIQFICFDSYTYEIQAAPHHHLPVLPGVEPHTK